MSLASTLSKQLYFTQCCSIIKKKRIVTREMPGVGAEVDKTGVRAECTGRDRRAGEPFRRLKNPITAALYNYCVSFF